MRAIDFNKVDQIIKEKSLKKKDLLKAIGLHASAYTAWRNGRARIQDKYYQPIADFLDIELENILGDENDPMLNPFFLIKES